jgi:prolyl-tRNA synthetase
MRMSHLFGSTLREIPTEAEISSHQLLLRAGFIRQLGAGIFTLMPLGLLGIRKMRQLMREGRNSSGGQELKMPVVHPADIWKETGRWYEVDAEMARFKDRNTHDMVLAMTHEEIVADLVRREIHSYRQMPALIYHFQTKFRDDPRPRAGLIRVREFTMLDSYSLSRSNEELDKVYQAHYQLYHRLFAQCALPVRAVGSDPGMMGGGLAHEFMYLTDIGEDSLLFCSNCDYAANVQSAEFLKPIPAPEASLPIEKIATPEMKTIEELSIFLGIPRSKTAKAVFYMADLAGQENPVFIFALIRGDMTLNETKLANAVSALGRGQLTGLTPAKDEDIKAIAAVPGFASPLGIKREHALLIVDDAIPRSPNLAAGANEEGYHFLNVNYGRDYQADKVTDIASAEDGSACPLCGSPMHIQRGVEVGHIFKLGTRYTRKLNCTYLDEQGDQQLVIMGSYGIGLGRFLACIADEHHDEKGLIWPVTVAPFPLHLVLLHGRDDTVRDVAEELYQHLQAESIPLLYDDREERAGVKFNDADLIGLPIRVTVSERSLASGGVEVKLRSQEEKNIIPLEGLIHYIKQQLHELGGALIT